MNRVQTRYINSGSQTSGCHYTISRGPKTRNYREVSLSSKVRMNRVILAYVMKYPGSLWLWSWGWTAWIKREEKPCTA